MFISTAKQSSVADRDAEGLLTRGRRATFVLSPSAVNWGCEGWTQAG